MNPLVSSLQWLGNTRTKCWRSISGKHGMFDDTKGGISMEYLSGYYIVDLSGYYWDMNGYISVGYEWDT